MIRARGEVLETVFSVHVEKVAREAENELGRKGHDVLFPAGNYARGVFVRVTEEAKRGLAPTWAGGEQVLAGRGLSTVYCVEDGAVPRDFGPKFFRGPSVANELVGEFEGIKISLSVFVGCFVIGDKRTTFGKHTYGAVDFA